MNQKQGPKTQQQTLEYLNSFGFSPDGSLFPPRVDGKVKTTKKTSLIKKSALESEEKKKDKKENVQLDFKPRNLPTAYHLAQKILKESPANHEINSDKTEEKSDEAKSPSNIEPTLQKRVFKSSNQLEHGLNFSSQTSDANFEEKSQVVPTFLPGAGYMKELIEREALQNPNNDEVLQWLTPYSEIGKIYQEEIKAKKNKLISEQFKETSSSQIQSSFPSSSLEEVVIAEKNPKKKISDAINSLNEDQRKEKTWKSQRAQPSQSQDVIVIDSDNEEDSQRTGLKKFSQNEVRQN
jgi:hypothetical protein